MKTSKIVLVLVAIGAVLVLWWFYVSFSLVSGTETMGPSAKARRDPYLAAGRLVDKLGVPWQGFESIASMPEPTEAIYLAGDRSGFVGRRQDDLVNWVEQGGHLIAVVHPPKDDERWDNEENPVSDELLTRLGITAYPILSSTVDTIPVTLPGEPGKGELEIEDKATLTSLEEPIYQISDGNNSVVLLSVARGFGRVTAVVDDAWTRNGKIGEHDHATLFWRLVNATEPSGLWIVRGDKLPGFLAMVVHHGWPALTAFGLLVLIWFLRAGARFGPMLKDEEPERRSLLEHLDAAGQFLWRCQAHEPMLRPMRDHLVREIGRRRPDWARLDDDDKILRLAELSDISTQRVHTALLAETVEDAQGFVRAVADLKTMESNL